MQRRNGEAFEALLSAELLEGGDSPELLTTVTDISELERARSALRTSEERFKSAFRLSPIGMTIARQTDGVFLEVNDANVKTLGYARDELIGKSGIELGIWPSPEERHLLTEKLVSAGAVAAYETRLKNRAGGLVDASFWATLIEFDGVPCVLASVLNITEQKREETLILDVARGVSGETGAPFFRSLVEHLGHALKADIVIVGEILGNAQVRTLALLRDATILPNIAYPLKGTPCETLAGQRSTTLYLDRVAEKFPEFGMLAETGMRGYMGLSLRDPDGSPIGVLNLLSRSPIEMSERSEALFRIFAARAQSELLRMRRDREIQTLNVSLERRVAKRTAQLESANQELEAFSYSVSHDLRAPLRAIDGFVRVLAGPEASSDEALREKAQERVIGSVKRMNSLIEDMIGLAQVSSQVIHHARVDLGMLAREVGESLRERNPGREVDLRVLAGPSVQCDRDLMRIVLENLLGNAWKFTGKRAQAKIEFGSEDLSGGQAAFYVRDNGAGFDPEYAHKLFSPFQRLHGAKEFDGTGIGLATVKRIIARHGGRVWALSEPDKGATFYFTCSVA